MRPYDYREGRILVPTLINFNKVEIGAVPIPINRSKAEIGAALTTLLKKQKSGLSLSTI